MGTLLSLSRSATVVGWDVAVWCTLAFGTLFLFGWLSEEFGRSEGWKKHRKLFLTLAIVGVIGEQIGTIVEFALSAHLETIDQTALEGERNARIEYEKLYGPRHLTEEQRETLIRHWRKYAGRTIKVRGVWDPETDAFADELSEILTKAGLTVRRDASTPTVKASGVVIEGSWADFVTLEDLARSLNCAGVWAIAWQSCTGGLPPCPGTSKEVLTTEPTKCDLEIDVLPRLIGGRGTNLKHIEEAVCTHPLLRSRPPTCAPW